MTATVQRRQRARESITNGWRTDMKMRIVFDSFGTDYAEALYKVVEILQSRKE